MGILKYNADGEQQFNLGNFLQGFFVSDYKQEQRQIELEQDRANIQMNQQIQDYLMSSANESSENNTFLIAVVGASLIVAIIIVVIFKSK